ncbi:MAG TPA: Ig-like domain-containing protein, partial [Longimicrobiales bacterium]|nr:Ig-like domain-containing protein [Longimicrobiales bacterium]
MSRIRLLLSVLAVPCAAAAQVATVEVQPTQANATVGDTVRFRAIVRDSTGAAIDTARVYWSAGPFDVAWSAGEGRIVPLRQGEAVVLAVVGGKVGRAVITVAARPPASIELTAGDGTVVPGGFLPVEATVRNADGENLRNARVIFRSSDERVAQVDGTGVVRGRATGTAQITASAGAARSQIAVRVVPNRVARIDVSGSSSARTGDVIRFTARALDAAGRSVEAPVRWSVAGGGADVYADGAFVAAKPGSYVVSAVAGTITGSTAISVVQRSHNRKLEKVHARVMSDISPAEHWAIGNALYVSTLSDRLYAFDITNPAAPVLTDSVIVDARIINDVQTTPDGRIGVLTREGSSSRKDGIVFLDLAQPLHPKVLSEYTATVTGGVHSIYIDGHYVYLTDDATGSMRVIDFADVKSPREVARWEVPGVSGAPGQKLRDANDLVGISVGRMLHDLQIVDGLAYLAYWRHGIVILDVGNGIKGGSPTRPQLVSQYVYNVADLYPPDRIAGTHTVFRYRNYL